MEDRTGTLIVILSMHRSGSSLTASLFERLGMSLGPFELNAAAPSNPHGHFEAIPVLELNRQVQNLALGFPDDLPDSPRVLARLIESQGAWPDGIDIPDPLIVEGQRLIGALIKSGEISGFKDPRTVLTWPFWARVFSTFPGLRVVPVSLLRSPHEIAMSLVTRRGGWCSYWNALDLVSVHLRRQKVILESSANPLPSLCFGAPSFLETLAEVVQQCGLAWDKNKALEVFDQSCVHHLPAVVSHAAQLDFEALCHDPAPGRTSDGNVALLTNDARRLEALRLEQWQTLNLRLGDLQEQVQRALAQAHEIANRLRESEARELENKLRAVESQERLIDNQHKLVESQQRLIEYQQRLAETERFRNEIQEKLIASQAREIDSCKQIDGLQARLERYESHPILGPAIRGRRRLRRILYSTEPRSPYGSATHPSADFHHGKRAI